MLKNTSITARVEKSFLWQALFVHEKSFSVKLTSLRQVVKVLAVGFQIATCKCRTSIQTTRVLAISDISVLKGPIQTEG